MNWKLLLVTLLLLIPLTSNARVIEAQGSARIVNGDTDSARQRAIENALQQALMMTGSSISSVQSIVNGVLSSNQTRVSAEGDVERVNIVREEVRGDRLFVVVQAEIWNRSERCRQDGYKLSVTVVPFEFGDREHGSFGQIWDLGKVAANRLTREISSRSERLHVSHTLSRNTGLNNALKDLNLEQLGLMAREIGAANDSQYVIFGLFDDLSVIEHERGWGLLEPDYQRNFALTLYLMSANNGELVTRARVTDVQPWTFPRQQAVDVGATQFWNEPFGSALMTGLEDLAAGVRDKLRCEPSRGRIVWQRDNQVQFNLGRMHGVQVGDELKIIHPSSFVDKKGIYRQKWQMSSFIVEVTQVSHSSAVAKLKEGGLLTNVQVDDWVVPASQSAP